MELTKEKNKNWEEDVLAIKEEVGIPVKFVGLGEKVEDLEPFDIEKYIYGLFKDL